MSLFNFKKKKENKNTVVPEMKPEPIATLDPNQIPISTSNTSTGNVSAMDIMSAFDNVSRSMGVNISYGENTDAKLKEMREKTQAESSLPCEKCGIDKETIEKKQQEQRKAVENAHAGGAGVMMMGMTPARDFYKCPKCGKIICSSCTKESCPFCEEKLTDESIIIKSKTPFVQ